ncbi:MAG: ATP-dependent DNA helicase RecG [Deltaproteobacteria bacterium]|nr:ATP-dependent DNA helicase RecG [Deltaproteobacteria bacterium]
MTGESQASGNDMPNKSISDILDTLTKPLAFASKDNFAHIHTVKGLEGLVTKVADEAIAAAPARKKILSELKLIFAGFDSLDVELKKERVGRAIEIVGVLSKPKGPSVSGASASVPNDIDENLKKLSTPIQYVKGIGPKLGERFENKGIATIEDALYFLPIRYEDRTRIKKIKELTAGVNEVVRGEVVAAGEARYGRRKVFEAAITDGASLMALKWFNYRISYMKKLYEPGKKLVCYGPVTVFGHKKEIIHPDVEFEDDDASEGAAALKAEGIVPVYSQIENMHQRTLRRIIGSIAAEYAAFGIGAATSGSLSKRSLSPVSEAFRMAHLPKTMQDADGAKKALAYDELFSLELGLFLKRKTQKAEAGCVVRPKGELAEKLRKLLPFELTRAQDKVIDEVRRDIASGSPMHRLVQGDVGSGKTVVSFMAALDCVECDHQAAIMAPTEILAEQHYINMHGYAEALGLRVALLTSALTKAERKKLLTLIKAGEVDVIVGTHALIQKDVEFASLALAVIDEQHRFGVVQRAELKKKGADGAPPHILVMTATPIPRTLSMTVFGDLDVSVIDELPKGRQPIVTKIVRESSRTAAYAAIKKELNAGAQAYIVYPLIEESEELPLKDATRMKEHLAKDIFTEFKVALMHGRLKSDEKEAVMRDFKEHRIDVLVSTTVIEVGVDVPNATVMLVEHAERFGLAQLHQLRGRVGRGTKPSLCLLMAAYTKNEDTWKRLKVLEDTLDGFKIAEEDLKIRGPGDFIGTRQSGMPEFRSSGIFSDPALLKAAREDANGLLEKDPALKSAEGSAALKVVKARWKGRLELAEVG